MTFIKNNSYLLLIFGLCVIFAIVGTLKSSSTIDYEEVTVSEGDTLWGLAVRYAENKPTEKWIAEVKKMNDLSSVTIIAGEELRIPSVRKVNDHPISTQLAGDGQ
jgi:LysM repeat protein